MLYLLYQALSDTPFAELLRAEAGYAKRVLSIERGGTNVRKDIVRWADVKGLIEAFFDSRFRLTADQALIILGNRTADDIRSIVADFVSGYNEADSKEVWFEGIKAIARTHGFAEKPGDYKRNPEAYKGTVADVAKIFRVLLLGQAQTPDLYEVMQVMGRERIVLRLGLF